MKVATVDLKLTKDQHVRKLNVTPIEALLLTTMHHKAAGENPITVVAGTETDVMDLVPAVEEQKDKDGKVIVNGKPAGTKISDWSVDNELDRLRGKYGEGFVKAINDRFRDLPKSFDEAAKMGVTFMNAGQTAAPGVKAAGTIGTATFGGAQ